MIDNLFLRKTHIIKYFLVCLFLFMPPGWGQLVNIPQPIKSVVPAPEINANSWVLANYDTGWIMAEHNADLRIEPASLTKLMTAYLVFESIKQGTSNLQDEAYVSTKAWKTGGTKMFINVESKVSLLDLIQGLVVQSGNDAAIVLAEFISGSEKAFSEKMNEKASELGMKNTHFSNSSGLPDVNNYSTARDITILSMSLIKDFPEFFKFYSQKEFTYNNITQYNRNTLLWDDKTVDGMKTGYTKRAGYCLIGTANRKKIRHIATVIGASSKRARSNLVEKLLEYGYRAYNGRVIYASNDVITQVPLFMGQTDSANISIDKDLKIIYPRGKGNKLTAVLQLPSSYDAPLKKGESAGTVEIKYKNALVLIRKIYIGANYAEGPLWVQLVDFVKKLFRAP